MNKILFALLGLLCITFAACSDDDDYKRATAEGSQVYFSNELDQTGVVIDKSTTTITIPIYRVNTDGELTVPIKYTCDNSTVSIPSTVTFEDGSNVAYITVTYDPETFNYDEFSNFYIGIDDEQYTTEYGLSHYEGTIGVAAPWKSLGTGSYREDLVTYFFNAGNLVYNVEIQENEQTPGLYRLVYPYGAAYPNNEEGDYDTSKQYYMTIDATDPDYVWVYFEESGMNWGYGMFTFTSYVGYYVAAGYSVDDVKAAHPELFGTLKDGVITMPAATMLISMADYKEGAFYRANQSGLFAVALPGYVIADYSLDYVTTGTFVDTSKSEYTCGKFTFGSNVASVRYALTSSADSVDAVYNGIVEGTVDYTEITSADEVKVPITTGTGTYYLVAVTYNADGEAVGYEVFTIKFTSTLDNAETWTDVYKGTYTYTVYFGSADKPATDEDLTLSQSESDPTRWKISNWGMGVDFIFTWDGSETVVVQEGETGFSHDTYGMVSVMELADYVGSTDYGQSSFDASTYTFNFSVVYFVEAGGLAYGTETFQLTGNAGVKAAVARARKAAAKKSPIKATVSPRSMKRASSFVPADLHM